MKHFELKVNMRMGLAAMLIAAMTACDGSSGTAPFSDSGSSSRTPWDTGGSLTMSEASQATGEIVSIFDVSHDPNRGRIDLAVGTSPWRHRDGTLYYLAGCGREVNYVAVVDASGTSSSASPCSDAVQNSGYSPTQFTYVMASPDKRRIAVETRWFDRDLQSHYDTVIYEDDIVIATYEGFYAAAWVDKNTLVMPSNAGGLYTVSIGGTPVLLENASANESATYFNNPDVSPDGNQLVFESNGAIWMMDITGGGLRELANDAQNLRYPVWSPDGQFVAFMRIQAPGAFDHLIIPGDPLNFAFLSNANERLIHYVDVNTLERWVGYFNEKMAEDKMPQGQLSWLPATVSE